MKYHIENQEQPSHLLRTRRAGSAPVALSKNSAEADASGNATIPFSID